MTDIEALRERYAPRPDSCRDCGTPYTDTADILCRKCYAIHLGDPSVLALCDEVEALRAQVAAERQRSREACQVLVAEVGANGPCSVGDAAAMAVAVIDGLRAQVANLEGYLLAPEPETHQHSPDDAPHTDAPFWLPDDL